MGDLSAHFSRWEFADRRAGEAFYSPPSELVERLEVVRRGIGRPLPIVSGHRSAATNRAVGGARRSFHLSGRAVDIPSGLVRPADAIRAGFTGIGVCDGWVVHLDIRPATRPLIFKDCPR